MVPALLVLLPLGLFAQDFSSFYNQFLSINSPDKVKNTGLTAFPVLGFSTGGEQQAMAGTYTAVARDTGYFESNAAGSAMINNTQIGVFHSNVIDDVNLEVGTFTYRNGDVGIGSMVKLLYAPFTHHNLTGQTAASAYYIESVLGINAAVTLLRDFYFSGISIGANIKVAYRSIPPELYQDLPSVANTVQSVAAIMADIGILTRFNFLKTYVSRDRNFSLGLSLRNIGPLVNGDPLPTEAAFGLAYSPFKFLLLSGDFVLPMNLKDLSKSEDPGFGLGMALQFTDFFAVRGGFMIKGGNPRFATGTDINLDGIDLAITYTLDYTTQLRIPDHLGVQVRFNLGDEGRAAVQKKIDSLFSQVFAADANYDYDRVIALCRQILEIDPTFTPAKEAMDTAARRQRNINDLDSLHFEGKTSTPDGSTSGAK